MSSKDNNLNPNATQSFEIVAIAASADGLKALIEILSCLPSDFPAGIAIVKHIAPDYPSFLAGILSRHTALTVKEAEDGETFYPSVVYIAPPNYHLLVSPDGILSLSQSPKVRHVRPAADVLFESVADSYKERAIAIVLTGGDMDGANGVKAIKQNGGVAIAQDQATSKVFGMPNAAIQTGCVDFILPLGQIGDAIAQLVLTGRLI